MKRLISILMALLLISGSVALLSACKSKDETTTGNPNTDVTEEEGYPLSFEGVNYGGAKINVLRFDSETSHGWTGIPNDIYVERSGGDKLEQAVYDRNQLLKEMIGVEINMILHGNGLSTRLSTDQFAGDGEFDLVFPPPNSISALFNNGSIRDLNGLDIDKSYAWWDQNSIKEMTFSNKLVGAISDITFVDKLSTIAVFYNLQLAKDLQLPDLYDLVDNKEWTFAKMKEYAEIAVGDDKVGISCQNDGSYYFLHSAGISTVVKDGDDLKFNLVGDRAVSTLQEIFRMMNSNIYYNRQSEGISVADAIQIFAGQNANLFLVRPIQSYYNIKDHENIDYGIIPLPLFDEVTLEYSSSINTWAAIAMCLPFRALENNKAKMLGDVVQAWGMISNKEVMPIFYEEVLALRAAQDLQSSRMLDIIFSNRISDVGIMWNFSGVIRSILIKATPAEIENAAGTIGSVIGNSEKMINNSIEQIFVQIAEFE